MDLSYTYTYIRPQNRTPRLSKLPYVYFYLKRSPAICASFRRSSEDVFHAEVPGWLWIQLLGWTVDSELITVIPSPVKQTKFCNPLKPITKIVVVHNLLALVYYNEEELLRRLQYWGTFPRVTGIKGDLIRARSNLPSGFLVHNCNLHKVAGRNAGITERTDTRSRPFFATSPTKIAQHISKLLLPFCTLRHYHPALSNQRGATVFLTQGSNLEYCGDA